MHNWISVRDELPNTFETVIVYRKANRGPGAVELGRRDSGNRWRVYGAKTDKVTHWMPLPDKPEEDRI